MENHIEIDKEEISNWNYKFHANPAAPKRPERNHGQHGAVLKTELTSAIATIAEVRNNAGIQPDKLLVLELAGQAQAKQPDVDTLQAKFNLSLVGEKQYADGVMHLVVQFESKDDIDKFEQERVIYESNGQSTSDLLTNSQRNELFSCIEEIRPVAPEDRTGTRLAAAINSDNLPDGLFNVDIDVLYDGDIRKRNEIEGIIKRALGTGESKLLGDLFVLPNLLLGRARVNRYTLESLRKLDLIAMVDFPMSALSLEQCELYSSDFVPHVNNTLDENAPLAAVIDTGVFSGNPLLSPLIVGEEDFDLIENTTNDQNGHGTGVAGIVAYGDFTNYDKESNIFKPLVRICNGKVMHDDSGNPKYSDSSDKRAEQLVDEAIRYFHSQYHCRVFNLSSGDEDHLYDGGRQMAWASLLDELSRELDIVIVVSAGNVHTPNVPVFSNRKELSEKTRDQLLTKEHRLIDPATAALGITVGSITRYGEPETQPDRPVALSVGEADCPSVFTRTGEGVNGAIKPEFVDYGGNYALHQVTASQSKWQENHGLYEPTLSNDISKPFKGWVGTSFSAPHVTHIAARLERALQSQIGQEPSANLIRALLVSSAKYLRQDWLDSAAEPGFSGEKRATQSWRLRLSGYGKVDDTTLFTDRNHVSLFAEDTLDLRSIHLYKIPVPAEFLDIRANKRITIGFAYNPPTRLSRRVYIANSLWFEVFRRIDEETLLNYKGIKSAGDETAAEELIAKFSQEYSAKFSPGYTEIQNSTLQQRVWEKTARGGRDLLGENSDPHIYILVTGKEKFKHPDEQSAQPYALAVTFSFEGEEDIELRQKLIEKVRVKQRAQIRVRPQIRV